VIVLLTGFVFLEEARNLFGPEIVVDPGLMV
jgi:hypothetical protein